MLVLIHRLTDNLTMLFGGQGDFQRRVLVRGSRSLEVCHWGLSLLLLVRSTALLCHTFTLDPTLTQIQSEQWEQGLDGNPQSWGQNKSVLVSCLSREFVAVTRY